MGCFSKNTGFLSPSEIFIELSTTASNYLSLSVPTLSDPVSFLPP